jgi:opacity protein-like surface antigen
LEEKMNKLKIIVISLLFSNFSSFAADDGYYAELGYTSINYSFVYSSEYSAKWNNGAAIRLVFGKELGENLAIEGMYASGINSSDKTTIISTFSSNIKLTSMYGVYLKPKYNISENMNVFARIGFVQSTINGSIYDGTSLYSSDSASASTTSYGVGTSYKLNDKFNLNLDYMSYYNKNSIDINAVTLGVGYKF